MNLLTTMDYGNLFRITLPETILEVVSLLVLLVDLGLLRKRSRPMRMTAACLLGIVGCTLAAVWLIANPQNTSMAGGVLVATPLVAAAQIGILLLTALVLVLSVKDQFSRNPGEFVAIVLLGTTGMMLVTAARDLLVIFVALELLSLSLYVLTAFNKSSTQSAEAALKYYLFGGMSAALMLFGFSYLYGLTGTTNLERIAYALSGGSLPLAIVALVLVAAGLGFKVAAVPFHLWAPDTYQGAPAPVTALIASGSKVASFALLVALTGGIVAPNATIYSANGNIWVVLLITMALGSIVLGNLGALTQTSVRRLLAYSAIAHAGYMLLGIAAHTAQSSAAVLYYALTYALTTVGAFGVIGIVERNTGSDRMDAFAGLSKCNPLLAATMLIFLLSLAGIPPLVGFWAKFNLFSSVLRAPGAGSWGLWMVILALGASAISLYYYLQVLKRVYVVPPQRSEAMAVGAIELATLTLIAISVLLLGIFPDVLSGWIPLG
jgi:NADH-quinone oxidoreductase subunit N